MQFNYVAYNLENGLVKGKVAADDEPEARGEIAQRGLKPLYIVPSKRMPSLEEVFPSIFRVRTGTLVRFSRQLATMTRGGSSLQRSMEMLHRESRNRVMRRVLGSIRTTLDQGGSLSASMAAHPTVFNSRYVSVVEVGEHTGSLADSLEQLADALERESDLIQRFQRTMMMPALTMSASVGMLILMMTVMLPPLLEAFESRGTDVPLITQIAMALIGGIQDQMIPTAIAMVVLAVSFWIIRKIPAGRHRMHVAQTRLPIVGSLIVTRELAQFSRTNAMLLKAGVTLAQSVPLAINGCKNLVLHNAFTDGQTSLLNGRGFAEALARHPVLPSIWVELVMVGEENNALAESLSNLADTYEREVENRLNSILALMEPLSTFAVGGVVLFMALSMFLPIYSGMQDLG